MAARAEEEQHQPPAAAAEEKQQQPDDVTMTTFAREVKRYLSHDADIRRLQEQLRELRAAKQDMARGIMTFMSRHNVEDLAIQQCRLRYKVSSVRAPLSQAELRERFRVFYKQHVGEEDTQMLAAVDELFSRDRVEKTSLRRVQGPRSPKNQGVSVQRYQTPDR